jgi:hypothetical protein
MHMKGISALYVAESRPTVVPSSGPATHGSLPQQLRSTVSSDRTTTTKAGTKAYVSVVSVSAPMASRVHHTESNPVCLHSCGWPYFCEPHSFCSLMSVSR